MDKERWKPIKGYEGIYEISDYGRVRSLNRKIFNSRDDGFLSKINGQILTPTLLRYFRIMLHKDGRGKTFSVHRLVALHFIPNPQNKECINHIDGNKENNYYKNLEWCSHKENHTHAVNNKLTGIIGQENGNSKLTNKQVLKIFNDKRLLKDLAKEYNVSLECIHEIKNKKRWKHLTKDLDIIKSQREIRFCSVKGCGIKYYCQNYCRRHYGKFIVYPKQKVRDKFE